MKRKLQNIVCALLVGVFTLVWIFTGRQFSGVPASAQTPRTPAQSIVLDAGHGGIDGGCVSVSGTAEKGINLSIVQTLRDALEILGFDVTCTREDDRSIHDSGVEGIAKQKLSDMKNRLAIINSKEHTAVLSVHQNKYTDEKYSGAQMFYAKDNDESRRLANCMKKQFVGLLQPDNTRETKPVGSESQTLPNQSCSKALTIRKRSPLLSSRDLKNIC